MSEKDSLVLKEIERVYGKIKTGYGILLLECYIYYPYNENCNMSYMLSGANIGGLLQQANKCDKPYSNDKLFRLTGFKNNRVCKIGLPIIEKIDLLNQLDSLTIFFDNKKNNIQLCIPLEILLDEIKPFTYLHCSFGTDLVASICREVSMQMIIKDPATSKHNVISVSNDNPFNCKNIFVKKVEDEGDWIAYDATKKVQLIAKNYFMNEIAYANNIYK